MDKPLRPMANRFCGCFVWDLAPFLLVLVFAVCFAVSSGETKVWLGDLRVVAFGLVLVFVCFSYRFACSNGHDVSLYKKPI